MHGTLASLQTAYMPEERMHVEKRAWEERMAAA